MLCERIFATLDLHVFNYLTTVIYLNRKQRAPKSTTVVKMCNQAMSVLGRLC